MDDRNLVAVAEQAAATSRVLRGPLEGATVKSKDGRVFLGCRLEFEDAALDQDAISNGIAAGRTEGMREVVRVGLYSPTAEGLPEVPVAALRRLQEVAREGTEIILSGGSGDRAVRSLAELVAAAGLATS